MHVIFRELDRGGKGHLEREDLLRLTQVGRPWNYGNINSGMNS